jgi:hypothetical protein
VAHNGRGTEEVRRELTTEREELVSALADLREDFRSGARRISVIAAGALAAGLALVGIVSAAKHLRD